MSKKIRVTRDYHEEGDMLYKKSLLTFQPGLTVLIGCNGSGKSTLLIQLKQYLKKKEIPFIFYDNLHEGGSHARNSAVFYGDFSFLASSMASSEGENITLGLQKTASKIGQMIRNHPEQKEFWVLLDAVDSGLSVDSIEDLKRGLFDTILQHNQEKEIYIIVSANEYEMARGEKCFDVTRGAYVSVKSYERYRNVILKTREYKDKRYQALSENAGQKEEE